MRESSSSSSTATGRSSTVSTGHVVNSGKRRKSIELPDLDPSLHFTSSQLQPASGLKGSVLPPEATRPTDTPEPEILLASHAHEVLQAQQGPPSVSLSETSGQMTPVTTPDSIALGANQSDSFISKGHGSLLPPLHPPADTIVAPPVPVHVSIPLGAGATATAASIVGSPWASGHNSPVTSPPLINASNDEPVFASLNTEALHIAASSNEVVQPSGTANTPSTQTSPTPQPLPVVAPLATLAAVSNPNAVEAVKAATVDLGAGPDGVPTLLTWTPGEGEGREGNPTNNPAGPSKVFVTGTFAKGWTTKIELGKKEYVAPVHPGTLAH